MRKICIVGYISEISGMNGQEIRTKTVIRALKETYPEGNVSVFSYIGIRKKPIRTLIGYIRSFCKNDAIILFPAQNAVRVLTPIGLVLGKIFNTALYINVIGGWLPEMCDKDRILHKCLQNVNGLFVQTDTLKRSFFEKGIVNVTVFPNFKYVKTQNNEVDWNNRCKKLCFMSRVTKQKGVLEMINVTNELIEEGRDIELDIYGALDPHFEIEFQQKLACCSKKIQYKGEALPSETVKTVADYYLQLFPTNYYTEGFPGSILDSIYAGTPVVVSRWESYLDVLIHEGEIGISYEFGNANSLKDAIAHLLDSTDEVYKMHTNCLKRALEFEPKRIIEIMVSVLENGGN